MIFSLVFVVVSSFAAMTAVSAQQYRILADRFLSRNPSVYGEGNVDPSTRDLYDSQRFAMTCLFLATAQRGNQYTDIDQELLEPWRRSLNWLSPAGECRWFGVTCDENNFVKSIDLSGNNVGGTFPSEIISLASTLEYLDISFNPVSSLTEGNAWIGEMTALRHLDMSFTNLDSDGIPPSLGDLTLLTHLDISSTFLWGGTDGLNGEVFESLNELEYLDISQNSYNSAIPPGMYNLPNLKRLYMISSDITGSLDFINELPNDLIEIWVDGNNFNQGPIPSGIADLTNLRGLSLTETARTGPIPSELGNLEQLQRLWLYSNSLTGAIPAEISELDNLIIFQVEDNLLQGDMPSEVCSIFDDASHPLKVLGSDCTSSGGSVDCDCCNCCEAPCNCDITGCIQPTPVPTPTPMPAPVLCFSAESTVDVLDKGTVKMADLKIGDKILVGTDGKYEPIYSFGHFDASSVVKTKFLKIKTSDSSGVEMTPNHLIFTHENKAVTASSIQVGDKVMMGSGETDTVVSIESVIRYGIFAPFTASGTIVTDGILSSSFATIQQSRYVSFDGFELPLTYHQLGVVFESPHRLLCQMLGVDKCSRYEYYNDEGMSQWVEKPMIGFQWLLGQNIFVSCILFFIAFSFFCMVNTVEMLVANPACVILSLIAAFTVKRRVLGKKKV